MDQVVMTVTDTKKCRIIPKRLNYIPDLLLHNQRIEKETVMEINRQEILRAMSLANVYEIAEDGTETLLTPLNFCLKTEEKDSGSGEEVTPPESQEPSAPNTEDDTNTTVDEN